MVPLVRRTWGRITGVAASQLYPESMESDTSTDRLLG